MLSDFHSVSHLLCFAIALNVASAALLNRRQGCDAKFRLYERHSACLPDAPPGVTAADRREILDYHNDVRSRPESYRQPSAANMQQMYWDDELEMIAQKWASACNTGHHDGSSQRVIPGKYSVGQNIAWHTGRKSWENHALAPWFTEHEDFSYGRQNWAMIGHYTQMLWASSSRIGCGYALCGDRHNYVCNYATAGNKQEPDDRMSKYRPYEQGRGRTELLDCGNRVCYNGGTMDRSCTCSCMDKPWLSPQNDCALDCSRADDSDFCRSKGGSWGDYECREFYNIPYEYCPNQCQWCPLGDGVGRSSNDVYKRTDGETEATGYIDDEAPFVVGQNENGTGETSEAAEETARSANDRRSPDESHWVERMLALLDKMKEN